VPEDSRVSRVGRLWFPTSNRLDTWLIPSRTTRSRQYHESTMVWRNLPLYHLLKCLLPPCHALFVRKDKTKYWKQWYRSELRQTMVDSWYCLDRVRVVPEGMSQVSRRLEVGNHKRPTLNTRLSSGTSARTLTVSAGPYMNYCPKAGTKNNPDTFFVPFQKKGCKWKIHPQGSNLISRWFIL